MSERRRHPRFPVRFEVALQVRGVGEQSAPEDPGWKERFRHRLRNLAVGGLFVEWPDPQPPMRSHVALRIRTARGRCLDIEGEVVWRLPAAEARGGHPPGFGVQFLGTTAAQVQAIADLLDGLTPEDLPEEEDIAPPRAASAPRILLLEDDEAIRRFTATILSRLPAAVVVCSNGREAVEAFEAGRFDLCVLDYLVPEMDGLAVIEHLRRQSQVPILLMSAVFSPAGLRGSGLAAHADEVLVKPFTAGALRAVAKRLLRKGQGAAR